MRVSFFNCRTDIWYVLINQGLNYSNYHLQQSMTANDTYLDCRVLKKADETTIAFSFVTIRSFLSTESVYFRLATFRQVNFFFYDESNMQNRYAYKISKGVTMIIKYQRELQ